MRWTTRCSSALLLLLRHFSPVCWMLPRRLTEVWRMWGLLKTGWEFQFWIFHLLELDFLLFGLDGAALVALVTMKQPISQFLPNQFPR